MDGRRPGQRLLEDCAKIKEAGYTPIAMGNKDQWLAESAVFNTYAYKYIDQDWFNSLQTMKVRSLQMKNL